MRFWRRPSSGLHKTDFFLSHMADGDPVGPGVDRDSPRLDLSSSWTAARYAFRLRFVGLLLEALTSVSPGQAGSWLGGAGTCLQYCSKICSWTKDCAPIIVMSSSGSLESVHWELQGPQPGRRLVSSLSEAWVGVTSSRSLGRWYLAKWGCTEVYRGKRLLPSL